MKNLQTYDDYLINFVTQLHEMRTQARENLITGKEKSKMYHDRKINPLEIKIGDSVFLLKEGKIKELDNQYTGSHEVLNVLGKGNVKIKIEKQTGSSSRQSNKKIAHKYTKLIN